MLCLKCNHNWCKDCMAKLVCIANGTEAVFPPRCCNLRGIDPGDLRKYVSSNLFREYKAARYEYSIFNRTYCHAPDCGAFIAPHSIHNGDAICQKCLSRTCAKCKDQWHFGPRRSENGLNDLAFREGWVNARSVGV